MLPSISIHLAQTRQEFEEAFRLLKASRVAQGLEQDETDCIWLTKHHALPSTNTIVAVQTGRVIAAICLFGESAFHLPLEAHLHLDKFRAQLEGRLSELSLPGIHPDFSTNEDLSFALFHFATCFGASYCNYDGFVTEAPVAWAVSHGAPLPFESIFEPVDGKQVLFLNARRGFDFRSRLPKAHPFDFHFPEKKFFLVAHQSMKPAVLNYLFNERTKVFASLGEQDLRVLKNIYDYGEYREILPKGGRPMPEKKTPRYPRFPMNCEGFLVNQKGEKENVQVLDVSREGVKLRGEQALERGDCYMLTLFIGVNKKTELITNAIWADEQTGISGLAVKSHDEAWEKLIQYLEKDFLKVA